MTDTRSRHVPWPDVLDHCRLDDQIWPCDAIREADRADAAEAGWAAETMRANDAEATLAAERRQYGVSMKAMLERYDAARADAKALAEALQVYADHERMTGVTYYGTEQLARARAALAAHKEATEA